MNTYARFLSRLKAESEPVDFEKLYKQEVNRIYNYFRFRLGDSPLAQDLTSETFERAWRNRRKYRNDLAAFSTWLFAIARRVVADYLRKHKPVISLEAIANVPDQEKMEEVVQKRVDFARLHLLLSQLAERDRELVALRYGAGLTNRAIARLTGLSESNVGVSLHRLVQRLREEWEEEL
jgi:RNA polymerase sigma-70 factor (ECF subfamily)